MTLNKVIYKFQCNRCFVISGYMSSNPDDAPECCGGEKMYPINKSILDEFKIGDKVEWIKVKRSGGIIDIRKYEGIIDEIVGSKALIKSRDYKRRVKVSLFDLKVIK